MGKKVDSPEEKLRKEARKFLDKTFKQLPSDPNFAAADLCDILEYIVMEKWINAIIEKQDAQKVALTLFQENIALSLRHRARTGKKITRQRWVIYLEIKKKVKELGVNNRSAAVDEVLKNHPGLDKKKLYDAFIKLDNKGRFDNVDFS